MLNAIAVGGAIVSMLATPLSPSPEVPEVQPMAKVAIETVTGSGCPAGSGIASYSSSTGTLTVQYSGYYAWRGEGSDATDFRKNCQLGLRVEAPKGWTYGLSSAQYRGFAYLEGPISAVQQTSYYFQGLSNTVQSRHAFVGPLKDYWRTEDASDELEDLGFAPCGTRRDLNVNTELRVTPGSAEDEVTSFLSMDSSIVYQITLKRCL